MLITDNQAEVDADAALQVATDARAAGVQIGVVGIGDHINPDQLMTMASSQAAVFLLNDYRALITERDALISAICSFGKIHLTSQ